MLDLASDEARPNGGQPMPTKSPLASNGIIASLLVVLYAVLKGMGSQFSEAEAAEASARAEAVIVGVFGLWALWGRWRARTRISIKPPGGRGILMLLAITLTIALVGCDAVGGMQRLRDEGVLNVGSPASSSRMNPDGDQTAAIMGGHPTLIKSDDQGIWKNTAGPTRTLTIVLPVSGGEKAVQLFTDSTDDLTVGELVFTPEPREGEAQFVVRDLTSGQTRIIEAQTIGYAAAFAALEGMTREQAVVTIEKWRQVGAITESVAKGVISALFPSP
jgi:hypothetical protein